MTLPLDIARCSGRFDLKPGYHGSWCPHRHTCQRFLAYAEWDQAAGLRNYKGISVTMAARDCQHKIDVEVEHG